MEFFWVLWAMVATFSPYGSAFSLRNKVDYSIWPWNDFEGLGNFQKIPILLLICTSIFDLYNLLVSLILQIPDFQLKYFKKTRWLTILNFLVLMTKIVTLMAKILFVDVIQICVVCVCCQEEIFKLETWPKVRINFTI